MPEIKGNHRKFRTLVTSYIGKVYSHIVIRFLFGCSRFGTNFFNRFVGDFLNHTPNVEKLLEKLLNFFLFALAQRTRGFGLRNGFLFDNR